jgi:hypothetical protein
MASLAPAADAEPLRQASKEEIRVEIRAVNNEAGRFGPNIVKLPKAHRDRIKALHGEVARVRLEALQTERAAKVAATEKLLNVRDATGLKLETAIRDVGKLYFELIDQNLELAKLWGFSNNARRVGALGESIIAREVSHAMFAAGRPHQGKTRFPSPGTVGLGITGDTSSGTLGERIAAASAALLEMIRAVPVAQPEDEAAA